MNVKQNTLRNYKLIVGYLQYHYEDLELSIITSEDILALMSTVTDGPKQNTKKLLFTLLSAFFNFFKNSIDSDFKYPCDTPTLRKLFRGGKPGQLKIIEKDTVDEMILGLKIRGTN